MRRNILKQVLELKVPHWVLRERANLNTLPEMSKVYYHLIIPKGYDKEIMAERFEESYENSKTLDTVLDRTEQSFFDEIKEFYSKKEEDDVYEINKGELENILKNS